VALSACGYRLLTKGSASAPGWGAALRRRLLGIDHREVSLAHRGIKAVSPRAGERLEQIGRSFLAGYHHALEDCRPGALSLRLEAIEPEQRGFAYEGAAMALYLLDRLTPWRRDRFENLLAGPGAGHVYMLFVGAGWVMARLHRGVSRQLARMDPLLRWMAMDGYGFHEAYFHPREAVENQRVPARLTGYQCRAFDLGLGRGLWFAEGADVRRIAARIERFATERRSDLWSGVGLACAYAGGVEGEDVVVLRNLSGEHRVSVAQGAAFAAKARQRAGNPTAHTELACQVLCETDAERAAAITDEAMEGLPPDGEQPAFEVWRRRIQAILRRRTEPRPSGSSHSCKEEPAG